MISRLGYACIALGFDATTNRSCRLANATPENLRRLIGLNLDGLMEVLRYNVSIGVTLFRVSSQLIPFASHPINQIRWWDEEAERLMALGNCIRSNGMRVSMHPGQFTVLSSPRSEVVEGARRDLDYHCRVLDTMGLGPEHKIIIHGGGVYHDRAGAMARLAGNHGRLAESIQARVVVENDESAYNVQEVLEISRLSGMPVVFDALHDRLNPSPDYSRRDELIGDCVATWRDADGPPKAHFSSQNLERRSGTHADWLDPGEFVTFAADTGDEPVDCMLEAKRKDLALLRLRRDLSGMGWSPVP